MYKTDDVVHEWVDQDGVKMRAIYAQCSWTGAPMLAAEVFFTPSEEWSSASLLSMDDIAALQVAAAKILSVR